MSFFITEAIAASPTAQAGESGLVSILMMVGLLVMFYFLLWRPQSKRAKEHRKLVDNLQKGDEIVTSGGILGRISKVSEKFIVLNISEGVDIRLQRDSISMVLPKGTIKSI